MSQATRAKALAADRFGDRFHSVKYPEGQLNPEEPCMFSQAGEKCPLKQAHQIVINDCGNALVLNVCSEHAAYDGAERHG